MTTPTFDAFALPREVAAEEPGLLAQDDGAAGDDGRVQTRRVDASAEWIRQLAGALRSAGDALADRPAEELARALGSVGARFLDPGDELRCEALELLPATSGLSAEMAAAVLDGMAADWTGQRLLRLLREELGDERVLDGFGPQPGSASDTGDLVMAAGPRLCVQIIAGSVPGVSVTALVRSLLLKGPTLVKPGRGDVVLPVLFARALRDADPALADALAVVYWAGGQREPEEAALTCADVVTAYGSDETVAKLRALVPVTTRFVAYHHRVSVGVVGREALGSTKTLERTATDLAESVALFDQRGCVSPQVVFVEGDRETVAGLARAVADRLARVEERLPSGPLDAERASTLHQVRGTVEMLAAAGEVSVFHGGAAPWTVILESGESSVGACAGRTIRLRSVADVAEVPHLLEPLTPHLQTVGVAGLDERLESLASALGRIGASRVVPFRSVAFPPPWWHHDGRGPLRDLVRWVDLERE